MAETAGIVMMSMSAVGKQVSKQGRAPAEVDRLAAAMGDMFAAYLDRMKEGVQATPKRAI